MANRVTIEIEVDPSGSGERAIRGINTSLDQLGGAAPGITRTDRSVGGLTGSVDLLAKAFVAKEIGQFALSIVQAGAAASDSTRVIKASALEAGLAYEQVAAQAEAFAERTAQAETVANRTYASILQFSKAAQQTDRVTEFSTAFADLAAARGIQAAQLGDIARQLQALTDEATDKLLGANPSAFYAAYAAAVGKSAESLTDAEKRAAVFDEVIRRGALFTGEAERRLGDVAGKLDTVSAKFENLKTSVGETFNRPGGFVDAALDSLLFGADALRGKDPTARNANPDEGKGSALILAEGAERAKLVAEQLRQQERQIAEALKDPTGSFENAVLVRVAPKISVFDTDPAARQKLIDEATVEVTGLRDQLKKTIEATLKDDQSTIQLLNLARTQIGIFDNEDERKFSQAIAEAIKKRTENLLKPIKDVRAETDKLFSDLSSRAARNNPFVSFFSEAEESARSFNRTAETLRQTYGALADEVIAKLGELNTAKSAALAESGLDQRFNDQLKALRLRQEAQSLRDGPEQEPFESFKLTEDEKLTALVGQIGRGRVFADPAGLLTGGGAGAASDTLQSRQAREAVELARRIQEDAVRRGIDPRAAERLADQQFLDATGRLSSEQLNNDPELKKLRIDSLFREADRTVGREQEARQLREEEQQSRKSLKDSFDKLGNSVQRYAERLDRGEITIKLGDGLELDRVLGAQPRPEEFQR